MIPEFELGGGKHYHVEGSPVLWQATTSYLQ
jgi:hypothetical protein